MMDGIEVLKTTALTNTVYNEVLVNVLRIIVICIILLMIIIRVIKNNNIKGTCAIIECLLMILLFIVGVFTLACTKEKLNGKFEYQVTIDNSVIFNEFNNKYEIINTSEDLISGEIIYTIREKEE